MTSEYVIDEIAKSLDLNPNRFELVAALLGCHILTVSDLSEFHQKLVPELKQVGGGEDGKDFKVGFERVHFFQKFCPSHWIVEKLKLLSFL